MDKKAIFKQILADFIEKPLPAVAPRAIDIPLDITKVVSLLGPRRAGKTHLLYGVIRLLRESVPSNRLIYLNFEDDRLYPLELKDMDALVKAYYELYPENRSEKVWFFFDEIQEVPDWEKFIRRLSDSENCRIYLTGSSSKMLSRELASTLRGRTLPLEVFPLSYEEFLQFNQIQFNPESSQGEALALHWFDRWLQQGGFPELVFLPENLHRKTINEYLDLMLYRDLTERFGIRQPAAMKYLLKYFLQNIANPISLNKVFNDLKSQGYGLAKNTLFDYVSHLEEAFLLFHADIWHRSARAQAVNPSKYYGIDPSFKYAVSINKDTGRMLENAVFLHLRRQGLEPFYFMEKQEVDFYWENGKPINVCLDFSDEDTKSREIKGMIHALEYLNLQEGLILTRDHSATLTINQKTIFVQPTWKYFLNLS